MPATVKKYLLVIKPGIVCGNLIAAIGGFFLASHGHPDFVVLTSTALGISLVVAAGCVFNNWADRDLDKKMTRTRNRVLALGLMSPKTAVVYASILAAAGFALLGTATNTLCAGIVMGGLLIYAGAYSLYLKRHSPYAIAIGSLAGAAPAVAGYCAASHRFDTGGLILLAIFTLWQIPHSLAIAVFRLDDYKSAAIPVLPVRRGVAVARRHILLSITVFSAVTLLLTFCGYTGTSFLAGAATLGLTWLFLALMGNRADKERLWARRLVVFSIFGIIALSVMMALDSKIPNTPPNMMVSQKVPSTALWRDREMHNIPYVCLHFRDTTMPCILYRTFVLSHFKINGYDGFFTNPSNMDERPTWVQSAAEFNHHDPHASPWRCNHQALPSRPDRH